MTNLGGTGVSENTDFDDEITELLARQDRLNPLTLAAWQADPRAQAGDVVTTAEYHAGFGGGATGDVIASGTENGANIVVHNTLPLSWELRIKDFIDLLQFGSIPGTLSNNAISTAFSLQQTLRLPIKINDTGTDNSIRHKADVQLEYFAGGIVGDGRFTANLEVDFAGTLIKKMVSSDDLEIANFTLYGPGEGVAGTKGIGAGGGNKGFFGTKFRNVSFRDMEEAVEMQFGLFVTFEHVDFRRLKRGVFAVGGGTGWNTTWFNNLVAFNTCVWNECSESCIDWVGQGLEINNPTMQSGGDGLVIMRDDDGHTNINAITTPYFEFNDGFDIRLKDTKLTITSSLHLGGDPGDPINKPDTLGNIHADNSLVYATGRPQYADDQDTRITLINGSKYTSMSTEIVSGKNSADATSEFIYLPDRAADKRLVQTFTDLDTTPVALAAPIGTSIRYTNHVIEWMVEAPNGEYTGFTTYGKLRSGGFKTTVVGGAVQVSENIFTVNLGTGVYEFNTSSGDGTMTIESDQTPETGDTIVTTRIVNSRSEPVF